MHALLLSELVGLDDGGHGCSSYRFVISSEVRTEP
jgi:hypothetical protein